MKRRTLTRVVLVLFILLFVSQGRVFTKFISDPDDIYSEQSLFSSTDQRNYWLSDVYKSVEL